MTYVDYGYYTADFGGSLIPASDFDRLARKAAVYLDYLTFGRASVKGDGNIKSAACDLAELYYQEEKRGGRASEDNDGYRVSWDTSEGFGDKLLQTALMYIAPSGLCYRGMPL